MAYSLPPSQPSEAPLPAASENTFNETCKRTFTVYYKHACKNKVAHQTIGLALALFFSHKLQKYEGFMSQVKTMSNANDVSNVYKRARNKFAIYK